MSLLTEGMRNTTEREITVYKDEDGLFHGVEYVNHPTPSGCERWLPTYSDNRGWPDKEIALKEFEKMLVEIEKQAEEKYAEMAKAIEKMTKDRDAKAKKE